MVKISSAVAKNVAGAVGFSPNPIYILIQNAEGISEYSGTSTCVVGVLFYDPSALQWDLFDSVGFAINSSVNTLNISAC